MKRIGRTFGLLVLLTACGGEEEDPQIYNCTGIFTCDNATSNAMEQVCDTSSALQEKIDSTLAECAQQLQQSCSVYACNLICSPTGTPCTPTL